MRLLITTKVSAFTSPRRPIHFPFAGRRLPLPPHLRHHQNIVTIFSYTNTLFSSMRVGGTGIWNLEFGIWDLGSQIHGVSESVEEGRGRQGVPCQSQQTVSFGGAELAVRKCNKSESSRSGGSGGEGGVGSGRVDPIHIYVE